MIKCGDRVWIVQSDNKIRALKCKTCAGIGKVNQIVSGATIKCPTCDGKKEGYGLKKIFFVTAAKVVKIVKTQELGKASVSRFFLCGFSREYGRHALFTSPTAAQTVADKIAKEYENAQNQ